MKLPAWLGLFERTETEPPHLSASEEIQTGKLNTKHLGRAWFVFSLPVLFFFGGSAVLIIFAACVAGAPLEGLLQERQLVAFNAPPPGGVVLGESVVRLESRPLILRKFLEYYRSPLAEYAQTLIDVADRYGLDWRLLPAIAGQESTFCRTIPEDSHNCWGWAIHESYTKMFETWESAIETVGKGLAEDYLTRGLETPEEIMTRYCPRSAERDGSWARGVNYFIWALENF